VGTNWAALLRFCSGCTLISWRFLYLFTFVAGLHNWCDVNAKAIEALEKSGARIRRGTNCSNQHLLWTHCGKGDGGNWGHVGSGIHTLKGNQRCDGRRGPWFVGTTMSCWECRLILCFKDSGILGRGAGLLLAGLFVDVSKEHLSSETPGNIGLNPKRHTAKYLSSQ